MWEYKPFDQLSPVCFMLLIFPRPHWHWHRRRLVKSLFLTVGVRAVSYHFFSSVHSSPPHSTGHVPLSFTNTVPFLSDYLTPSPPSLFPHAPPFSHIDPGCARETFTHLRYNHAVVPYHSLQTVDGLCSRTPLLAEFMVIPSLSLSLSVFSPHPI